MAYFNAGKYDQSITAYNDAVNADSSIKLQVLDTLAYVYTSAGQRDKAISTYQELIGLLQQQPSSDHTAKQYEGMDSNAAAIQTYQHDIQVLQQKGATQ
jgi:tetratricopeptide (TPR) repeat protein